MNGDAMSERRLQRKVPLPYKEYGGWVAIGETDTYYLANQINCEGGREYVVIALPKDKWELKP